MGLRSKVSWVFHGHDNTTRTLDVLSADLRALQQRVDALVRSVAVGMAELREDQLAQLDSVRDAVITATDDLSMRIAALHRADVDADADADLASTPISTVGSTVSATSGADPQ